MKRLNLSGFGYSSTAVAQFEDLFEDWLNYFCRPSGTEDAVRVYAEADSQVEF